MSKVLLSVSLALAVVTSSGALADVPDNTIATGIDFDMDVAVVPANQKYSDCLTKHRPMVINGKPTFSVATDKAIAACKEARVAAMAEADAALAAKPGWESKSKRDAEVTSVFDNTDASARKVARDTDAYVSRLSQ